jgi:hypothetical protein
MFLASRVGIWVVAVYAWIWIFPRRQGSSSGYVTQIWVRTDSNWFIAIAQHGYQKNGGEVFYPLYPLLIGGLGRAFGGAYTIAAIVISLACCAGAFVLLYRLAEAHLGEDGARRTVLYLAVFPMSLFLQAAYNESLYLLLAVAAFYLAERRRWAGAGVAVGLGILTRIAGVALLPPLLFLAWRSPERRRAIASLAVAPLLGLLYPLWLELSLHAPRAELSNEGGWNRYTSKAGPFGGLWHALQASWGGIEQLATGDRVHRFWTGSHSDPLYVAAHNLEDMLFFLVFVALGVVAWRRLGIPYGLFVFGSLLIPLTEPHRGYPLLSMPRFCLMLFPAFMAAAAITPSARRERAVVVTSSVLLGVAVTQWAAGYWVS